MATLARLTASGPSASAEWPVNVSDPSVNALKQQISEQEVVIAVQSNMLSAVTAQAPALDQEIVKTLGIFQRNQEKQQGVIDSLVEEVKRVTALLGQSENRLQEAEKAHAVYVQKTEEVMAEQRAQIAALDQKYSKEVGDLTTKFSKEVAGLTGKIDAHIRRFDNHTHYDQYTNRGRPIN